jgi:hypothetical protein
LVGLAISRDGVVLLAARVRILDYFIEPILYRTLVDLQVDAQNSYLFTYNTLIKILLAII